MSLAVKCDPPVPAEIAVLGKSISPSAIAGEVSFVVINAVKSFSVGVPHVVIKIFKLMPTLANRNAFSPVMLKRRMLGVFATLDHCRPSFVNGKPAHPMGFFRHAPKASTRNNFARKQVVPSDGLFHSAIAATNEIVLAPFVDMGTGNHN